MTIEQYRSAHELARSIHAAENLKEEISRMRPQDLFKYQNAYLDEVTLSDLNEYQFPQGQAIRNDMLGILDKHILRLKQELSLI
jgi:hypothetical protein